MGPNLAISTYTNGKKRENQKKAFTTWANAFFLILFCFPEYLSIILGTEFANSLTGTPHLHVVHGLELLVQFLTIVRL